MCGLLTHSDARQYCSTCGTHMFKLAKAHQHMHERIFLFLCFFPLMCLFPFYVCPSYHYFLCYLYLFISFVLFPSYLFLYFIFLLLFFTFSFNNLRFFSFYNTPIIYLIYLMDYSSLLVMRKIEPIKFACACMQPDHGSRFCSLLFSYFFISFNFFIFLVYFLF